jgi:hypothetical protein
MLYTISTPAGPHSYRGIQPVEGIGPLKVGSLLAFVDVVSGAPEVWLLQDEAALSALRRYYRERPEGPCSHVGAILARVTTERLWEVGKGASRPLPPAGTPALAAQRTTPGDGLSQQERNAPCL